MNTQKKILLLALVPLLLWGVVWSASWRRLHPPPTALDNQVRTLLLSADRVDVEIEALHMGYGAVDDRITHFSPQEIQPVVRSINLTEKMPYGTFETGNVPAINLRFFKNGNEQGILSTSYSPLEKHCFWTDPAKSKIEIRRYLYPTTTLRLRELIAEHPEIMRALIEAQADPQHLASKAFADNLE